MSIRLEGVSHIYQAGTPFEKQAIHDVNMEIADGEFVALVGQTGSGKSTLIQHLNGLLRPTTGRVIVDDIVIEARGHVPRELRSKVGLIFQYPEDQLFEQTVFKDVAFGPKNLGLGEAEIKQRVQEALTLVGLDAKQVSQRSPFELSGGEKRRVAIAGVLAVGPDVLVLDEPTAGLDPAGRATILNQLKKLHHQKQLTIVLVTHSMEDVAALADRVFVMSEGTIVLAGSPREIFAKREKLASFGLEPPQVMQVMFRLKDAGLDVRVDALSVNEVLEEIVKAVANRRAKGEEQ